jgi:hypothetical protein
MNNLNDDLMNNPNDCLMIDKMDGSLIKSESEVKNFYYFLYKNYLTSIFEVESLFILFIFSLVITANVFVSLNLNFA